MVAEFRGCPLVAMDKLWYGRAADRIAIRVGERSPTGWTIDLCHLYEIVTGTDDMILRDRRCYKNAARLLATCT